MADKQGSSSSDKLDMPFGGFFNKLSYLSESQKNRLLCGLYFFEGGKVNYKAAAHAYGTQSVNSMSVHFGAELKKLREADANTPRAGTYTSPLAKKSKGAAAKKGSDGKITPAKSGTKRKAAPAVDDEDDEEGGAGKEPKKKAAKRGTKKESNGKKNGSGAKDGQSPVDPKIKGEDTDED